ncbi:hypothetical protein FISHEDRAFT_55440 [Fistulina hepatica ATCC 64428]|uniref:Uncharacterized protein n=1 Tax=Fistulina hepatica ATCC 64428 TaxID=1128425 RepID=A0A0D7AQL2_9AGAR|nr:hypothetical protein FISHEDRAFT_55440 [Fistulina hepatica ATCC 64428]
MSSSVFASSLFPPMGDVNFYSALLAFVRESLPDTVVDPLVFQSILLCLIAGEHHLILQAKPEEIGCVVKLALIILTSVFGFRAQKLKIRSNDRSSRFAATSDPEYFLKSLFLPPTGLARSPSPGPGTRKDSLSRSNSKRGHVRHSHSRTPSRTLSLNNGPVTNFRSMSDLDLSIGHPPPSTRRGTSPSTPVYYTPRASTSSSRLPADNTVTNPFASFGSITSVAALEVPEATVELPQALVISGLEHAHDSSQKALTRVLSERQVVLSTPLAEPLVRSRSASPLESNVGSRRYQYNLPEPFILVYVCPLDPHERPGVHKSLLDKFSMSVVVSVRPELRPSIRASIIPPHLMSPNPKAPSPSQAPQPPAVAHVVLSGDLLSRMRNACQRAFISPMLSLYLSDVFTAVRHHPHFDGTLLTASAKKQAEDLARAARVLGVDLTGMELVRDEAELLPLSPAGPTTPRETNGDPFEEEEELTDVPVLDVSEADIGRVVTRVVSHRLRVRDGPQDEIYGSVVYLGIPSSPVKLKKVTREAKAKELLNSASHKESGELSTIVSTFPGENPFSTNQNGMSDPSAY